jgi:hydrogenase expression/formation protein HypC
MCLGIPGEVVAVEEGTPLRMATVDFGGVRRSVSLAYVPEAGPGDWCVVHVGFALSKLDPEAARRSLETIRALLEEELGPPPGDGGGEGGRGRDAAAAAGGAGARRAAGGGS